MPNKIENSQNISYNMIEPFITRGELSSKDGVRAVDTYIQQLALLRLQNVYPEASNTNLKALLDAHDAYYRTHYSGFRGLARQLASTVTNAWNNKGWHTTYSLQNKAIRAELIPHNEYHYQRSKILFAEAASHGKKLSIDILNKTSKELAAEEARPKGARIYEFIDLSKEALQKPLPEKPAVKLEESPAKKEAPKAPAQTWSNWLFAKLSPLPPPKPEDFVYHPPQLEQRQVESEKEPAEPEKNQSEAESEAETKPDRIIQEVQEPPAPPPKPPSVVTPLPQLPVEPIAPPPVQIQTKPQVEARTVQQPQAPKGIALINAALLQGNRGIASQAATIYLNTLFRDANVVEVVPSKKPGKFIIRLEKPLKTVFNGATVRLEKELVLKTEHQGDQLFLEFTRGFTAKYYFTINAPRVTIAPSKSGDLLDTHFSASLFKISATFPLWRCIDILNYLQWS